MISSFTITEEIIEEKEKELIDLQEEREKDEDIDKFLTDPIPSNIHV